MSDDRNSEPPARMRVRVYTVEVQGSAVDLSTVLGTLLAHAFAPEDNNSDGGSPPEGDAPSGDVA